MYFSILQNWMLVMTTKEGFGLLDTLTFSTDNPRKDDLTSELQIAVQNNHFALRISEHPRYLLQVSQARAVRCRAKLLAG